MGKIRQGQFITDSLTQIHRDREEAKRDRRTKQEHISDVEPNPKPSHQDEKRKQQAER